MWPAAHRQVLACWCIGLLLLQPSATKPAPPVASANDYDFQGFAALHFASSAQDIAAFEAVHNYTHKLPAFHRLNGIVNAGANARLRSFLSKLLNGKTVRVGVVGGSISQGYGTNKGKTDWFSIFTKYLQSAFPSARIKARIGARHSAHSEFIGVCLEKLVSQRADLVFVEVSANDGYLDSSVNNPRSWAFERIVRKVLKLPHKPAVVVVNALQPGTQHLKLPYYHTIEDYYGVITQYYHLPWLSLRDSLWQGLLNNQKGFGVKDIFIPMERITQKHLNDLGHKFLADLAVELIQCSFRAAVKVRQPSDKQTFTDVMLQPLALEDLLEADFVPLPMFLQNYEHQGLACAAGLDLKGAVMPDHTDWHFVYEPTGHKHKWGFASQTPGSTLTLKLNTQINAQHPIPQLSGYQKVHILTQHGMLAAAAALQQKLLHLPRSFSPPEAAAAAGTGAQGNSEAVQDSGVAAALAESDRQAAAAAQLLRSGQYQLPGGHNLHKWLNMHNMLPGALYPLTGGPISMARPASRSRDRVVGLQGGRFQLPLDALKGLAVTKTHTGVEVVMGRRLSHDLAGSDQGAGTDSEVGPVTRSDSGVAMPLQSTSSSSSNGDSMHAVSYEGSATSSNADVNHGLSRTLLQAVRTGRDTVVIPPPADAVYLRPGLNFSSSSGSGSSSAFIPIPTAGAASAAGTAAQLPGAAMTLGSTAATLMQPLPSGPAGLPNDMFVWIGFVRSHHEMGRARIQCVSGCTCQELVIDAWHRQAIAQAHLIKLRVTQSPECLISVKVLEKSSSGGHQFKVTGVMVGRAVEYDQAAAGAEVVIGDQGEG